MSDETKTEPTPIDRLREAEKAVRQMYLLEQIDRPMYSKQLLVIAHDYIVIGQVAPACRLVEAVTHTYLEDQLPGHIADDPAYGEQLHALAQKLVEHGVVDLTPVYYCTGAPAKA